MAITYQQTDIINAANGATAFTVGAAITGLVVGASAEIAATGNNGTGIAITSSFRDVTVRGTVVGSGDGISSAQASQHVTVAWGGLVYGGTGIELLSSNNLVQVGGEVHGDGIGVMLQGASNALNVTGTVTGQIGVLLAGGSPTGAVLPGGAQLTNTGTIAGRVGVTLGDLGVVSNGGTISGTGDGAIVFLGNSAVIGNTGLVISSGAPAVDLSVVSAQGLVRLTNSGTIATEGFRAAIEVSGNQESPEVGRVEIVNAGLVQGDVLLAGGADLYDGTGGLLLGRLVAGRGDDTLIGGERSDHVLGGEGADEIDGAGGDDWVEGGAGGDLLDGGAGLDWLSYRFSAAGVAVNLATGDAHSGDAEGDVFAGFERLRGSAFGDSLVGAAGNETIAGGEGDDVVTGGAGADRLLGGAGADTVVGGGGGDLLHGGEGADVFRFLALADSTPASGGRDRIRDFVQGEDVISLAPIDANATGGGANDAFSFLAGSGTAFTGTPGEVRFVHDNGTTRIEANVNGDTTADFAVILIGIHNLVAADFIL